MSPENVEIVRGMNEAFNRGDIDQLCEFVAPDVEWIPIMAALEGRVYRGHEGIRKWVEDLRTDWEIFETHQEEYRPIGDRVLVLGHWHARARGSRVELDNQPASWVIDVRDGKIVRLQTYTDRQEALEAVGIPE